MKQLQIIAVLAVAAGAFLLLLQKNKSASSAAKQYQAAWDENPPDQAPRVDGTIWQNSPGVTMV
jgi:hypothetical protein